MINDANMNKQIGIRKRNTYAIWIKLNLYVGIWYSCLESSKFVYAHLSRLLLLCCLIKKEKNSNQNLINLEFMIYFHLYLRSAVGQILIVWMKDFYSANECRLIEKQRQKNRKHFQTRKRKKEIVESV